MRLIMTRHLRDRMLERGVIEEEVRATIADPDEWQAKPGNSRMFVRQFGGRTLKVWVVWPPKRRDQYIVKSTAWKGEVDG